mmetsp:Transcript_7814/g.16081  ORF Transcript_7814/g.16081 Transcript_7814/m.16081 type:complete len:321 (+) Transcript_7814:196-1158(+)
MKTKTRTQCVAAVAAAAMLAASASAQPVLQSALQPALQGPHCEEYSFKSSDDEIDKPLDHTEVASIYVGDHQQISDVFVTSKLLVKQFNGVKIELDVVSPDSVLGEPAKRIVLKDKLKHNPNFLMDHMKPLMLKVVWRDDAEYGLGEALERMPMKEVRRAKKEFVEVEAKPDVSLRHLARGLSANAGAGGSKGTWELSVENASFRRREHAKLLNWDLTLCFDGTEALANESHESGLHDVAMGVAAEGEEDDVVYQRTFGFPRLGQNLPRFGEGLRTFGRGAFGGAGLMSRLRPQALMPVESERGFRLFRIFRRGEDEATN